MEERENCKELIKEYNKEYFEFERKISDKTQPITLKKGLFGFFKLSSDQDKLVVLRNKIKRCLNSLSSGELACLSLEVDDTASKMLIDNILDQKDKRKWFFRLGLIPTYTEVSLFLMGLTFLFLFLLNSLFKKEFLDYFFKDSDPRGTLTLITFMAGFMLSIYHAFSNKVASELSRTAMLFFALFINFFAGLAAGFYALRNSKGYLIIFPIINIISAILLIFLFRAGVITTDTSILDRQARLREIILGSILICIIFFVSQYLFHNYWATTFSLCVAYATNINNFISKKFFNIS
jgi:hypothetical protein